MVKPTSLAWSSSLGVTFLATLSFRILGGRMAMRSRSTTSWRALGEAKLAIASSGSAENKPRGTACDTSGSTLVASTNRAAPNFQRPSTPCFDGTRMRLNATYFLRIFRLRERVRRIKAPSFGKADGSLEAGPSKSSLLRDRLSSSPKRVSDSAIRDR